MKKSKISISFSKNYEDIYDFLIEKPNISQFICQVVKEKMFQEQEDSLENQVEKIVERLISEKEICIKSLSANPLQTTDNMLKDEDKDLIDSLF